MPETALMVKQDYGLGYIATIRLLLSSNLPVEDSHSLLQQFCSTLKVCNYKS